MKRILLASVAFAMLAIPAANAQSAYRNPVANQAMVQNVRTTMATARAKVTIKAHGQAAAVLEEGTACPEGLSGVVMSTTGTIT